MKKVTKEEFEEFIKNYDGPGVLYPRDINFITPSSTIYCDLELHPEMNPGIDRIFACLVAEHVYPDAYDKHSVDKYYIYIN